jgi:hypothetical protein
MRQDDRRRNPCSDPGNAIPWTGDRRIAWGRIVWPPPTQPHRTAPPAPTPAGPLAVSAQRVGWILPAAPGRTLYAEVERRSSGPLKRAR